MENEIEAIAWKRCIGLFLDLIPLSYSLCSSPQQIKKTEHTVYSAQRMFFYKESWLRGRLISYL